MSLLRHYFTSPGRAPKTSDLCLFAAFIASQRAFSFPGMEFTRVGNYCIGIAFAHAIFWSITASLAIRLAPAGNVHRLSA